MNNDKTITVPLLKSGISSRTGFDYSEAIEKFDFNRWMAKRRVIVGECEMPDLTLSIGVDTKNALVREEARKRTVLSKENVHPQQVARMISIVENNVSHRLTNFRVEDGVLLADASSCGPYAELFEKLHEKNNVHFGMRAFVELDGMKVKKIREIVTFDLVSTSL